MNLFFRLLCVFLFSSTLMTAGPIKSKKSSLREYVSEPGIIENSVNVSSNSIFTSQGLIMNLIPDKYYYYPHEDVGFQYSIYNLFTDSKKLSLKITFKSQLGQEIIISNPMMPFGGNMSNQMWINGKIELPCGEIPAGNWEMKVELSSNNVLCLTQKRYFGVSPYEYEELSRSNFKTRNEPIYFMLANGMLDQGAFRLFKKWGFDVAEPDITWGDLEPQCGVYNFQLIDKYIEYAKKCGIKLGIKIVTWNLPFWMPARMVSSNGDIGICPPNRGAWVRTHLVNLWGAIAQRYKDNPHVIWYTPTIGLNDGPMHGSFDKPHTVAQCYDYSQENKDAWPTWLQSKGYTLSQLNNMYLTNIISWSDVILPSQDYKYQHFQSTPAAAQSQLFDLFLDYNRESVTEAFSLIWQRIRTVDNATPILWKAGGGFIERQPKGFDYNQICQLCDTYDVTFTSTATPVIPIENLKIEYCRKNTQSTIRAGEIGAPDEQFPAPPIITAKGLFNASSSDMPIMGLCYYPADIPADIWGYQKNSLGKLKGYQKWLGNFNVVGNASMRTYTQQAYDILAAGNSNYRENLRVLSNLMIHYKILFEPAEISQAQGAMFDSGTLSFEGATWTAIKTFVQNGGVLYVSVHTESDKSGSELSQLLQNTVNVATGIDKVQLGSGWIFRYQTSSNLQSYLQSLPSDIKWTGSGTVYSQIVYKGNNKKLILLNATANQQSGGIQFGNSISNWQIVGIQPQGNVYPVDLVPCSIAVFDLN